ncbi:bifunctional phosphoribosylaminoimidazolecarboxamide formyltransferase/IMP cyclohydrolase [Alkaliphilus sp. B6464]|uniref:bifunctional phosphoribosylaminoimidazolecarboxamide formyltransferase/IMP cyclohydrolase n=1 Tax=Alkaliphilus sp. B6464 TaxID=2731219 RepID=UPI001BADD8C3|nr:bifunctional phosphoribosylaminoimidazolecarboxamide formyltransferase/IMP cyclohydrolase [Alkaliphilus sp. B6464]QUH19935.1 bifunctional phosphoribosylaminoimidazolecarboxamide formyltransferase/IMP cyclohydrolase [Alkaliphilus sp. B6464]
MIKRALISVSNKEGIVELAKKLVDLNIEILSTGGTAKLLREAKVEVKDVSDITGFPECLDGRVKTLHPSVHGGILAIRSNNEHMQTLENLNIRPIDLVIINLYPFKETILKEGVQLEEAIENIDIGGPTMLRAAAKNYSDVTVVIDPMDYDGIIEEIKNKGNTSTETRYNLALKVFEHTAHYDSLIANYLRKKSDIFPENLTLTYEKVQDLRYGENPHQMAAFYKEVGNNKATLVDGIQIQGKELSFNNINDANGALELLKEFEEPTVVAVKHTNPCGVASGKDINEAWDKAYRADPLSIFGGIIAANRPITKKIANSMKEIFLEVVIAPDFTEEALQVFEEKKNLRLIKIENICSLSEKQWQIKKVQGGILVQEENNTLMKELKVVTNTAPNEEENQDLVFAFKIVKHVKSNAIVLVKNKQTLAIGPGQTSRIWALQNAIRNSTHSLKGSVLASDAFFPFRDCVDDAAKAGVSAIIQPGGSIKDDTSIEACNEHGISMVFTGMRHFKH